MQFLLHIFGQTQVGFVERRLASGERAEVVMDDFNAHPTPLLIQYLSHHGRSFADRLRIFDLALSL